MKSLSVVVLLAAACAVSTSHAATTLERTFQFPDERFQLSQTDKGVAVRMAGDAMREFRPGQPDLPMVSESVEIPNGMRVASVDVVGIDSQLWRTGVRVAPAVVVKPGITPEERTAPDPVAYARAGFQPEHAVELVTQGYERGVHKAMLRVNPVRWDARTGRLERFRSVQVRLQLEPDPTAHDVLVRERIVPEWESDTPAPAAATARSERGTQPFKATQLPSVLGSPVAYVIITSDALAAEFQRLADWKTQSGWPAVVRTMTFIRQNYPAGVDDADKVRLFLRDAYQRWGTKWVLLGGDTEILPTRLAITKFYGGESIACDMYFSCLDGNWNADGDSLYGEGYLSLSDPGDDCDLMPDVYVGRAPVTDVSQAHLFVDKTLQYEKSPVGDYEQSVLFFAEVLFPQNWVLGDPQPALDGAEIVEEVLPYLDAHPELHYARLYQNYVDSRWVPGALPESREAVLDSLNVGYNLAVHIGHGYRNVMSVGDANLDNGDALGLTNGNRLFNLYAINCTSNAIDFPCIGEAFLHAPLGGAVTNIGSTRFDFPTAGRNYQDEYFKQVYQNGVTAVGEAQARQKLPFIPFSTYDGVNRWTQMTLLLIGDPELRMYTSRPKLMTVVHAASMPVSDTTFLVHVQTASGSLAGARVTAFKANDDYRSGMTDASGNVLLNFRPDAVGTFTLTVTGMNCRPYQATVNVAASPSTPLLAEQAITIDDDAVGGTDGNADGNWDSGETVDLMIPLRNNGGVAAPGVSGTLSTPDPLVNVTAATVTYGTINPATTANGATKYRVQIPYTSPDQREVPFTLRITDTAAHSWAESVWVVVRAPEPRHQSHGVTDVGGNNNQRPDPGEAVSYFARLRNLGTGPALGVTAVLRNYDGLATITDSTSSFGTIAPLAEVQGDAFAFSIVDTMATFELRISTSRGLLATQRFDVRWPGKVLNVGGASNGTNVQLTWWRRPEADLQGYNVYRSLSAGGPFTRLNIVPTDRSAFYLDGGLSSLTRYYYRVSAVDSSGNEGALSDVESISTSPPIHALWPQTTPQQALSPVALEFMYSGDQMDIAMASDMVYLWHTDGEAPVDADGSSSTIGDFSLAGASGGQGFRSGPSIGDLGGSDGSFEVVAAAWDSSAVYVFDRDGNIEPGWPFYLGGTKIWSGVAIGDLNNDGSKELVFGSNGPNLYAMRANGQEWINGDNNAGTKGVFKTLSQPFNYGTPAIADIDGNGQRDIIYAGYEGKLNVWRPDGSNLPGFPVQMATGITGSVAVGYLDGAGDTSPELVIAAPNDSLYVISNTGVRRPGWPVRVPAQGGADMQTSPALADVNGDGFLDVVFATSDGFIKVFNRDGTLQPAFTSSRYSTAVSPASSSSPVVADIDGDGRPDIVMGDNSATLSAFSGLTGQLLAGFPIVLPAEVFGTPGLCDCDRDGKTEIVVADLDGKAYMWDYDFPFSPGVDPPWPQFHHDARRTGLAGTLAFTGVPLPGGSPARALEFSSPWPNPAAARAHFAYAIPQDRAGETFELAIYDVLGRRLRLLESGRATPGRFTTEWNLRGDGGEAVGNGIYFARFKLGTEEQSRKLVIMP